jgi:hypothetical protein
VPSSTCGLYRGLREFRERNWADLPFAPASLDAAYAVHGEPHASTALAARLVD